MRGEEFFSRLQDITERFVRHEATLEELWRAFCLDFYTEEYPEGAVSEPLEKHWEAVYDLVYMAQADPIPSEDRAVGLIGEEELRRRLAQLLARGVG